MEEQQSYEHCLLLFPGDSVCIWLLPLRLYSHSGTYGLKAAGKVGDWDVSSQAARVDGCVEGSADARALRTKLPWPAPSWAALMMGRPWRGCPELRKRELVMGSSSLLLWLLLSFLQMRHGIIREQIGWR